MIKVAFRFIYWLFHFIIFPFITGMFLLGLLLNIRLFEVVIQNKKTTELETSVLYKIPHFKTGVDKKKARSGLLPEDFESKEQKEPKGIKRILWLITTIFGMILHYFIVFTFIYFHIFVLPYLR